MSGYRHSYGPRIPKISLRRANYIFQDQEDMDYQEAIDSYDIDVEMGRSHEQALRFALQSHGISRQLIEHYLRETSDPVVEERLFGVAVVDLVTAWTVHAEQYENASWITSLDHEMVADDLIFSCTRRFPKHRRFFVRDGFSKVIEILMLVNLHMFVEEDES